MVRKIEIQEMRENEEKEVRKCYEQERRGKKK